jgi:hypothetical protein
MKEVQIYRGLADAVLFLHFGIVVFVVGGVLLIVAGNLFSWSWVDRWWFRIAHLGAIAVVVAESWLGIICPLTTLESWLRSEGGLSSYDQGFVEHWVHQWLFYEAPAWVFTAGYSIFGILVLAVWYYFPPRVRQRGKRG